VKKFYLLFSLLLTTSIFAQDITFTPKDLTQKSDSLGKEIVFNLIVKNTSTGVQIVFLKRTKNVLPDNWVSSLCFGDNCFPPNLDSVVTSSDFNSKSLQPGEEREVSLHVFTAITNGSAEIELQVGTIRKPDQVITIDLSASTQLTDVKKNNSEIPSGFSLAQNYPNPFNPSTTINFSLPSESLVKISVYNSLGQKVSDIADEIKPAGNYKINYTAANLSSGLYFYSIEAKTVKGNEIFKDTKKMLFLK